MRPAWIAMLAAGVILGAMDAGAERAAVPGGSGARSVSSDLRAVAPPRGLPSELERDPGRGLASHEPVFLEPAATTTEHTRLGLSAWIAAGAPFDHRDNPGGPALGFTIVWPPPAAEASPAGSSPWRGSAAR
jgi:hypothetical protein